MFIMTLDKPIGDSYIHCIKIHADSSNYFSLGIKIQCHDGKI